MVSMANATIDYNKTLSSPFLTYEYLSKSCMPMLVQHHI